MPENKFSERYRESSNADLLNIIANAKDYQPLAVEAAQLELKNRQLSAEQLSEAKAVLDLRMQKKINRQEKIKEVKYKVKSGGISLLDNFNPIRKDAPPAGRYAKFISVFLGGLFLYRVCNDFSLLQFMFTKENAKWDWSTVLIFIPWIILPIASILFWLKKKPGWILTAFFFSYTTANVILALWMEYSRKPSGIPALDALFPSTSPMTYIGTILFFGGLTRVVCRQDIRELFEIDNPTMKFTIGIGVVIVLLMAFAMR